MHVAALATPQAIEPRQNLAGMTLGTSGGI